MRTFKIKPMGSNKLVRGSLGLDSPLLHGAQPLGHNIHLTDLPDKHSKQYKLSTYDFPVSIEAQGTKLEVAMVMPTEPSQVVIVTENERGYRPYSYFLSPELAESCVATYNKGYTEDEVRAVVCSSFRAQSAFDREVQLEMRCRATVDALMALGQDNILVPGSYGYNDEVYELLREVYDELAETGLGNSWLADNHPALVAEFGE